MFRFENIEGSDNPEQSRVSEAEKKPDVPSEADKHKLERPENKTNDYQYKYKPESGADTSKDKLTEKPSYAYHWDGKPTHNVDWDTPASPATKEKVLCRW
jgi:hypothetical protein